MSTVEIHRAYLEQWSRDTEKLDSRRLDAILGALCVELGDAFRSLPAGQQHRIAGSILDAADTGI